MHMYLPIKSYKPVSFLCTPSSYLLKCLKGVGYLTYLGKCKTTESLSKSCSEIFSLFYYLFVDFFQMSVHVYGGNFLPSFGVRFVMLICDVLDSCPNLPSLRSETVKSLTGREWPLPWESCRYFLGVEMAIAY